MQQLNWKALQLRQGCPDSGTTLQRGHLKQDSNMKEEAPPRWSIIFLLWAAAPYVSSGPPRARHKDGLDMQDTGWCLWIIKEKGAEVGRKSFQPSCRSDACERREGRKGWLGRACSAVLRKLWPGWGESSSQFPERWNLHPAGLAGSELLMCSVIGWESPSPIGLWVKAVVDPKGSSWGCLSTMFPAAGFLMGHLSGAPSWLPHSPCLDTLQVTHNRAGGCSLGEWKGLVEPNKLLFSFTPEFLNNIDKTGQKSADGSQNTVFCTEKPDIGEYGLYLQASGLLKTKPRIRHLDSQSSNKNHHRTLSHKLSLENWRQVGIGENTHFLWAASLPKGKRNQLG